MSSAEHEVVQPWRRFLRPGSELTLPEGLIAMLDAGQSIVLVGRVSTDGGKTARASAVDDSSGAVDQLADQTGLDFSSIVPPADQLMLLLKNAEPQVSRTPEGTEFTNRFVVLDLRAKAGLVLLLSTGSGHFVDESLEQPFVKRAGAVMMSHGGALFYSKRDDRAGRVNWELAPLMSVLSYRQAYLGDQDGIRRFDDAVAVQRFVAGTGSKKVAKDMPRQTRRGQRMKSGNTMVNGCVAYHGGASVPAGFGICWLKGPTVKLTERIIYLDTEACRPDARQVAFGLAEVFEPNSDGSQGHEVAVDQVENVRFVLARLGRPGWSQHEIALALMGRQMSSVQLRALHGVNSTLSTDPAVARSVLTTILANLDVYESGVLTRQVGAGLEPITVTGCFPPDGPWASEADFSRIRTMIRRGRDQKETAALLAFSGVRATYNDQPVVVLANRQRRNGQLRYRFELRTGATGEFRCPPEHIMVAEDAVRQSIIDGLMAAAETPVQILDREDFDPLDDKQVSRLRSELHVERAHIELVTGTMDDIFNQLSQRDRAGRPVLEGALLERARAEYNRLDDSLPEARERIEGLQLDLDDRLRQVSEASGIADILRLVESLRDPLDRSLQHLWKQSVAGLAFTAERFSRDGSPGKRLTWSGTLRFNDAQTSTKIVIPFDGSFEEGAATTVKERQKRLAQDHVVALLAGTPFPAVNSTFARHVRAIVADELGISEHHRLLAGCDDPLIVKVATHLLCNRSGDLAGLARELNVSLDLVRRVRELHVEHPSSSCWLLSDNVVALAFFTIGAANAGRVTAAQVAAHCGVSLGQVYNAAGSLQASGWITSERRAGYRITPCGCGSHQLTPLMIAEPNGPVCGLCRQDRAGVVWPAEPYDRYSSVVQAGQAEFSATRTPSTMSSYALNGGSWRGSLGSAKDVSIETTTSSAA